RGMKQFHGESSLKTWIYRIAIHEASNRRRWWFRHKSKETNMESQENGSECSMISAYEAAMVDKHKSPFENAADDELRPHIARELRNVPERYRTTVEQRDIEDLSYDDIAEVTQVSLGTGTSPISL